MFPSVDREVLSAIFSSCGRSFEATVEYMLANDAAESRDEKQIQSALCASLADAALSDDDRAASPPGGRVDSLSALSADLFALITDHLNLFELARLAAVSRDARAQIESGAFARVDKLDLARYSDWPDWRLMRMLARFPSTTNISFRNTAFKSFDQLAAVCFGRRVRQISFAGCSEIQDRHCHELFGLGEHLTALDLSACELTDDGLEQIATARHNAELTTLTLAQCRYISSMGVGRVLDRCTNLQRMDLKGTNVTRTILQFTQQQSKLAWLNLSTCKKLPAELSIQSPFCQLVWLNLGANPNLRAVSLSIPTLTHLNLSNSKHVQSLSIYTPGLRVLNLNGCLTLSSVATIPHHSRVLLTRLEDVNANLCRSISALSFQHLLASAADTLTHLSCRGCILLSDANIALLLHARAAPVAIGANGLSPVPSAPVAADAAEGAAAAPTRLEWLDLSGCKAASASSVMLATRMVADANQRRAAVSSREQRWDDGGDLRPSAFAASSDDDHDQWSGGLDDDLSDSEPLAA